ncbi:MAG: hypothetical protein KME15_27340 [Drouetiella hepatica Uher 2000/2452]|uniref:Uncharacterized protein n=1 Tax=Drouetiella hepatica Uher 2000/2452 TaxID=904376 RepID=A0A951QFY3_9CYAN|nr:hypothetical protein [Drouetiella hepatica Uher 2000/2452]
MVILAEVGLSKEYGLSPEEARERVSTLDDARGNLWSDVFHAKAIALCNSLPDISTCYFNYGITPSKILEVRGVKGEVLLYLHIFFDRSCFVTPTRDRHPAAQAYGGHQLE